jgi:hypothetical protein
MIYIEGKDAGMQFKLLEYLSDQGSYTLIAWQYPEIDKSPILFLPTDSKRGEFEPVTNYADGIESKHTKPMDAQPSKLVYLINVKQQIRRSFDSFCLYKQGADEWYACTIGHEGMCLIRDDELITKLQEKGFTASTSKPNWW